MGYFEATVLLYVERTDRQTLKKYGEALSHSLPALLFGMNHTMTLKFLNRDFIPCFQV
jgi:hypothetical protein